MESTSTPNYQQVIVDVPEDRVAEFHAFFGRFLATDPAERGPRGRRHRRPHRSRHGLGGQGRAHHGRRCDRGEGRENAAASEQHVPEAQSTEATEV